MVAVIPCCNLKTCARRRRFSCGQRSSRSQACVLTDYSAHLHLSEALLHKFLLLAKFVGSMAEDIIEDCTCLEMGYASES
jgi:hypothetical protein